jgi:hypothetical protein
MTHGNDVGRDLKGLEVTGQQTEVVLLLDILLELFESIHHFRNFLSATMAYH